MKTVLITGASRGIGRATALQFASKGYTVFINYNSSFEMAMSLRQEIISAGGNAEIFKADVSNKCSVDSMVYEILSKYKHIDVLVNNAGVSEIKPFTEISNENWQRMFEVNVNGVFYCTQAVVHGMLNRKEGAIVNVSSVWGQCGASCETHYSASKSAVIGFTKALAKELAPSCITVNCVCPGVVASEMNKYLSDDEKACLKNEIPLNRFAEPIEIAEAIYFMSHGRYITGQVLSVNGGWVI